MIKHRTGNGLIFIPLCKPCSISKEIIAAKKGNNLKKLNHHSTGHSYHNQFFLQSICTNSFQVILKFVHEICEKFVHEFAHELMLEDYVFKAKMWEKYQYH